MSRGAWRHAFPYATVAAAACITGVAFALVVGPPKHATGPSGPATVSQTTPVDVAPAPVPDHGAPALPRAATRAPREDTAPRAQNPTEAAAVAPERTRVVVATPARSRTGIVRVRDRRAIGVAARTAAEPVVVMTATSSESSTESAMLFISAAPAVVEIQAP